VTDKIYFPEPILQPTTTRERAVKDTGKGISFEEILQTAVIEILSACQGEDR